MKPRFVHLIIFGFILTVSLNYLISCSDTKSPTNTTESKEREYSENQEMKDFSNKLVKAFQAENKSEIISNLNEESKTIYSEILTKSEMNLVDFGNALEKRKLIFSTSLYAEYEITINNITYTIAYSNSGDDNWQLTRF